MIQHRDSITDFLTDGALAALCEALEQIAHQPVTLHDARGRRIIHQNAAPPWRLIEAEDDATRTIAHRLAAPPHETNGPIAHHRHRLLILPINVDNRPIGAIAVHAGDDAQTVEPTDRVATVAALLASTVGELCEQDELARRRNSELSVLFRLSSLLVEARDTAAVLEASLTSAIDMLHADAGTVHLLDESGELLELRAHARLSERFVKSFSTLPASNIADRAALDGRVRCVADLIQEGRALFLEEIEREGLTGLVSIGLIFKGRTLGIMRLYTREPRIFEPDEQSLLQTIVEQASAAVASAALIESERRHREVQRQLRLAAEVQHRMLPGALPDVPRLDLGVRYVSCFDLGGDFYDFINLNGHIGVLVGDVVGKGVPAALLMASVRASLRAHALDVYHLDDVMRLVNKAMVADTLDNEFATVFYGVINPATLRLTYCNAGHEPPFIAAISRRDDANHVTLRPLLAGGMAIGIDDRQRYERDIVDLAPGERLIAYTDGVIDAMNFEGKRFGRERLKAVITDFLAREPDSAAQALVDHIVWEMRRYTGLNDPTDDATIVVLRTLR